jgi:membrane protein YdbS with pleckstrin-like domain
MYCNKCGAKLSEGSRFCNQCGALTAAAAKGVASHENPGGFPQPAAPVRTLSERPDDDEVAIFTLRPTLIFVLVWYVIATIIVIGVAALLGVLSSGPLKDVAGWTMFVVILVVGLVVFSVPVYKHFLRRREVYTLTNHKLEMRYGIIAKTVRNIPLTKIQDVTVTASVWQRLLKLGDIVIDSASETGKIVLDEIHNPEQYAKVILTELRRRN